MVKKKRGTTNDELARMIARGFEQTATKQELKGLETRMDGFETRMNGEIKLLRNEMHVGFEDIKHDLKPLKEHDQEHADDIIEINRRLGRIEKKIGIERG